MSSRPNYITVADVMTPSPVVIDGLASIQDALDLMESNKVNSLVIDRRHEGDEYGLISVSVIASKIISQNKSFDRSSVYEIMEKPVLTVSSTMEIKYAIRLLTKFSLSRALVTEIGQMVGFVTLRDMTVRYARAEADRKKDKDTDKET